MTQQLLTIPAIAKRFNVHRSTVWRWCLRGILPCIRIGGTIRVKMEDVEALEKGERNETIHLE